MAGMSEFDYVVVGAGSAGCALASRLSEDRDVRVLLLEAGPRDRKQAIHIPAAFSTLFKSELDWAYQTEPQPALDGRSIYWPRGKMLGGSSSMNAMMWVRGFREDYDGWAQAAGPSWSFDAVLPYLQRVENTISITELRDQNPLTARFLEAATRSGLDSTVANSDRQAGVTAARVTQRKGKRWSAADAYLRPARRRTNLVVETGALIHRVVVDNGRAVGVDYQHNGQRRTQRCTREVLMCAGAVNTPQLLMLSGIGPADHLRRLGIDVVVDSADIGRNLQDHLATPLAVATTEPVSLFAAQSPKQLAKFLVQRRGMLTSNVAEAYAFCSSSADVEVPDVEILFAPVPFLGEGLTAPTCHGFTVGAILQQPASSGVVELRSADPAQPPRIDPRYLSDPDGRDRAVLGAGVERCRELLRTSPLREIAGQLLQPRADGDDVVDVAIRRHSQTLYHPVGTCRMGSAESAPLDPELRLRGVDGLRVVDASVLPQIIRGHTNAPTIMIAERAAEFVRGRTATVAAQRSAPPTEVRQASQT